MVILPFPRKNLNIDKNHIYRCDLYPQLPKPLQKAAAERSYLLEYLHWVPVGEVGIPAYYSKLSRRMKKLKYRNLIYPIKGGLFVHIYPDLKSERDYYIPIEPSVTLELDSIMPKIERQLMDIAEQVGSAETEEERKRVLLKGIDMACTTNHTMPGLFRKNGKIHVTPRQLEGIKYLVLRDKIGLGVLQPLLLDPYIEDIGCSGVGNIFIEHSIFGSLKSAIVFSSFEEVDDFVIWLGERVKKPVTVRNPIVDTMLPDGSRLNVVYGKEISKRGSNFTIRKFSETPYSILELIDLGTINYLMVAYLSLVLEEHMNVFVVGETASGKTTMLNALTTFIPPDSRIVSIEDSPELQVPHKNWIREVTRGVSKSEKGEAVGMFDLLKAALRQRPDIIIVGEIRGREGLVAFQAMQVGHGVMSTFHASSMQKLIQRLTGDPINVPKPYLDNLDVVVIQNTAKVPGKGAVRRTTSINEIVGYDPSSSSYPLIEVFRWKPETDTFEFPGHMNSYLLETKIAPRRGIPPRERKKIYEELERRARILERLHKDKGVKDFYELFQVLAEARRKGLF